MNPLKNSLPPGFIVNADDLGIHPAISAGILSAYRNGILTSCTMLVTTDYLEETLRDYVRPAELPIGVHLSLTLGKAVTPVRDVPDLVDEEGYFKLGAGRLLLATFAGRSGTKLLSQIEREFEAQFARAHDGGLRPTHADSHQHVHMNPAIFQLVEKLLPRFGIARLRLARENFRWAILGPDLPRTIGRLNPIKWALLRARGASIKPTLAVTDDFFGVLYSGVTNKEAIGRVIAGASNEHSLEICMHPGFPAPKGHSFYRVKGYNDFISSPDRLIEHDILLDVELADLIRKRGFVLRGYEGRVKEN
jgi:chitin disaccharide deacetylase